MNAYKRILAVVNTDADQQPALDRGARLARASGAELRLQVVVYDPELSEGIFHWDGDERAAERKARTKAATQWLEKRAAKLDVPRVSVRANWGHPFDKIVLSVVTGYRPDVLVLQPRSGADGRLSLTEWRLLSQCPVPVWMARAKPWPESPKVLAAVDPSRAEDKPASLDRDIVAAADALSGSFGTGFRILHAMEEIPSAIGVAQSPAEYERELRAARLERIHEIVPAEKKQRVEFELSTQPPVRALRDCCAEHRIDLVVMGMLARSATTHLLIGSTAREFIPRSDCDVLLIKSRDN